ncbi:MAG: hypothetical protein ACI4MP_11090 [Candidatus Ventricola sp.]
MRNLLLIAAVAAFCGMGWRIMGKFDGFLNVRAKEKSMLESDDAEEEMEKRSRM